MKKYLNIRERVFVLFINILIVYLVNIFLTGNWIPSGSGRDLWLISTISYYTYNLLSAPFFITPSESLASSITSIFLLWTIDLTPNSEILNLINSFRWLSILLNLVILVSSSVLIVRRNKFEDDTLYNIILYKLSINLGKSEIIFTPPVLISIFGFYQDNVINMAVLGLTWIVIITIKPVETVVNIIADIGKKDNTELMPIGKIQRIDSPNIIRVSINSLNEWDNNGVNIARITDTKNVYVLPLFAQIINKDIIGTGLCIEMEKEPECNISNMHVYKMDTKVDRQKLIKTITGIENEVELVGFVVEGSNISHIKFEISSDKKLEEGFIVLCKQNEKIVYYQILDACTIEENFSNNPRGTHIVTAAQLGILNHAKGFVKYPWVPEMNTPIFLTLDKVSNISYEKNDNEFVIGKLPHSDIEVVANFDHLLEYHTAILGVTGTGKTEMAFDIIKFGLKNQAKIFCVDFTGDYRQRLSDYDPVYLNLGEDESEKIENLIFDIETGKYHAEDEKKKYKKFIDEIQPNIKANIREFLETEGAGLGIFELPNISTTKATLRATELYLSEIFSWARENRKARKILIVLEEAHTIVPEGNMFRYDRAETDLVINRISQIALQGRKYGVGLLILSQRTALVSKTILSQCNTYITFSLVDRTSLDYLSSVYNKQFIEAIPNLKFLQALVYGKGIKSERPMIIEIPYDQEKKKASERLNQKQKITREENIDEVAISYEFDDFELPF